MTTYVSDDFFDFFNELKDHNDREWFQENKLRFQSSVQDPLIQFIRDFEPALHEISPHFKADPKKNGGSLFRIYRDVRFSTNKKPYKTHAAIHFRHETGKSAHAPGFYLHLEPDSLFLGAGIWVPEPAVAQKIRLYISEHPEDWIEAMSNPGFKKNWTLNRDEKLKRPPRNIDPDHELIEDLKLKMFIASRSVTRKQIQSGSLSKLVAKSYAEAAPLMKILCQSIKIEF